VEVPSRIPFFCSHLNAKDGGGEPSTHPGPDLSPLFVERLKTTSTPYQLMKSTPIFQLERCEVTPLTTICLPIESARAVLEAVVFLLAARDTSLASALNPSSAVFVLPPSSHECVMRCSLTLSKAPGPHSSLQTAFFPSLELNLAARAGEKKCSQIESDFCNFVLAAKGQERK